MTRQKNDILQGTLVLLMWGVTEKNRHARFYTITRAGRKQLALEEQSWARLQSGVQRVLGYA
jgi:hypothetical protein